jgi:hypothetical protein
MRSRLTRRALIVAGGACAAATAALPGWNALSDPRPMIRAMIARHLGAAPVEAGAVDAFVEAFIQQETRLRPDGFAMGTVCNAIGLDDHAQACINNAQYLWRVEERVIDLFIRSTDLLDPDRRASAPIRYVAFWDPYSGACRNPFADVTPGT